MLATGGGTGGSVIFLSLSRASAPVAVCAMRWFDVATNPRTPQTSMFTRLFIVISTLLLYPTVSKRGSALSSVCTCDDICDVPGGSAGPMAGAPLTRYDTCR